MDWTPPCWVADPWFAACEVSTVFVLLNPRGCAGSSLTTAARLFTAADSNDISTAIQVINKARPWTTLMAFGWEYSTNILTKCLAEDGENTLLTAATCIDNPFDLEEATRSSPYHMAIDQKLTGGLINILRSNKNDDGTVALFSIPRGLIAENPFPSLLLCSCVPSTVVARAHLSYPGASNLRLSGAGTSEGLPSSPKRCGTLQKA